jgi:hypothetical protein
MQARIINNYHWGDKTGEVVREEEQFIIVRIKDPYNAKLSYNIRFPRSMVKFEKLVAQA